LPVAESNWRFDALFQINRFLFANTALVLGAPWRIPLWRRGGACLPRSRRPTLADLALELRDGADRTRHL
jgi:hypothetical protein